MAPLTTEGSGLITSLEQKSDQTESQLLSDSDVVQLPSGLYTYASKCETRFDDILTFTKLYQAYIRARRGKTRRTEIRDFDRDRIGNIVRILDILKKGEYMPSPYRIKTIYEPKERVIMAQPIRGRIVHQWIVTEAIIPFFIPRLIPTTYACIEGRGTLAAVAKAQTYMRECRSRWGSDFYIVQMDISKYFMNIDRDILFEILAGSIVDPKILDLLARIIFDPHVESGIPIGNFTSQQLANIYMDQTDYYVTRELGQRRYCRYMDDFLVFVQTKAEARQVLKCCQTFVEQKLNLKLNQKSRIYPARRGANFAGYRINFDYKLLRPRHKESLAQIIDDYEAGRISTREFVIRVTAWYGHARHADCARYVLKHLGKYRHLLPRVFEP